MEDVRAIILNRSNRKFWYIRSLITNKDGTVSKYEESTGVKKAEKTLAYMQNKFLPVWLARKFEEKKVTKIQSKEFNYFAKIFLKDYEKWHDYQNIEYRVNRILTEFGKKNIASITKLEIKQFLNSLKNTQTKNEISKNTKNKYLRVFHGVFEIAVDGEAIDRNFTYEIKLKEVVKRDLDVVKPFSSYEVNMLLKEALNTEYGLYLYDYLGIAFNQGMSPSEIIGLQIGDIDLIKRSITIRRDITKGKIKETKTVYRDRTIPLFDASMANFENLIREAKRKTSLWLFSGKDGKNFEDIKDIRGNRILVKDGKVLRQNTKWYKLLVDCGIEYRGIKNCRHTFAVAALESKAFTPQQIANILGHGSLKMLLEHYAKWLKDKAMYADTSINLFEYAYSKHG